ncbi:MAG: hypothetical protein MZU95_01615 [Desulfomicrobium escambiense]|nr:hypothetical protein [Desulfomicrobium escambiense]
MAAAFFGLGLRPDQRPGRRWRSALLTVVCFLSVGVLSASFILVYKTGNPFGWVLGTVSGLLRRGRLSRRAAAVLDPLGLLAPARHLRPRRHEEEPPGLGPASPRSCPTSPPWRRSTPSSCP